MSDYIDYLSEIIPEKDSLKIVKTAAKEFYEGHTPKECYDLLEFLYASDNFQIQEVGVFLAGYVADLYQDALDFLRYTVSCHESWKVQETLAMSFDNYCAKIGYEKALPVMKEWLTDSKANVRRAVSEGLRVWTSRPYFKDHPQRAVTLLASLAGDESEYVRKSAGNSLHDIAKKYPDLVADEIKKWELSSKRIMQVCKRSFRSVLTIQEINDDNIQNVQCLAVFDYQKDYIETIKECLQDAESSAYGIKWYPKALYLKFEPIGFFMYGINNEGYLWLDRFMIDMKNQGKGYGKIALYLILDELHKQFRNVKTVCLSVSKCNKQAIAFYQKAGFKMTEHLDGKDPVMAFDY